MKIKKLTKTATIPEYKTEGSAGFDFYADSFKKVYHAPTIKEDGEFGKENIIENPNYPITLQNGDRVLIGTGLALAVPAGNVLDIRPRSGLALKQGLTVCNSPGTIDSDYRGEIGVILLNTSNVPQTINLNDRIAQGVLLPFIQESFEVVDELDETERGEGGFGSTGKS